MRAQKRTTRAVTRRALGAIDPGEIQSLDLIGSQFVSELGQRIELRPVINVLPNAASSASAPVSQLSVSVHVLDALTGFGTVLEPLVQRRESARPLVPQILAGGQTMRFNVVAGIAGSCTGELSFAGKNGNAIGPTLQLNLAPNTGTSLDLKSDALGLALGQRIDVQPILTVTPAQSAGPPVNSVCQTSVEVFDNLSGRTWTYQSSLGSVPAVQ